MGFQWHKISGSLVFIVICMTVTLECNALTDTDGQATANGCETVPGRDGRDGRDGIQGPPGPPGNLAMCTRGATYVRWGRNVCPPKALTLYSGFVAGSHFTQPGSGANNVCLPKDPQWNRTVAGYQSASYLYGTEFEIHPSNSGFRRNNAQRNHDAQCAVCQTPGRLTQLMIPARLECPSGWNLEYLGFLMSQHHTYSKSEYVCVDQDPDVDPATNDDNGNLFYQVEVVCGSYPM